MKLTCPYCQSAQIVQGEQRHSWLTKLILSNNIEGNIGFHCDAITCANPECAKTIIAAKLTTVVRNALGHWATDRTIEAWALRPQGMSKPVPDCIPLPIAEDYTEACRIRDLSPKASATLIRRCLQGMIRDFCEITKPTLDQEIRALRQMVDNGTAPKGVSEESVDAIDQIRGVGNIGAHMEKDINLIIPVEANEAQLLIELTEMLFSEWYIAREKRTQRLAELKKMAGEKQDLRKAPPVAQLRAPGEG